MTDCPFEFPTTNCIYMKEKEKIETHLKSSEKREEPIVVLVLRLWRNVMIRRERERMARWRCLLKGILGARLSPSFSVCSRLPC